MIDEIIIDKNIKSIKSNIWYQKNPKIRKKTNDHFLYYKDTFATQIFKKKT